MFNLGKELSLKKMKAQLYDMFHNPQYLSYRQMWTDIRDKQLPFLGEFLDTADATNPGRRRDLQAFDGCAWRANLVFAGGMKTGLTPQTIKWFDLSFESEELNSIYEAKLVLEQRRDILAKILDSSNFYNATHTNYLELAFGQAPLGIFDDADNGLYFEAYPIGSYAYDVNGQGVPNCFAVKKKMTAQQIKSRFTGADIPEEIVRANSTSSQISTQYDVCWIVKENPQADNTRLGNMFKPFISLYWVECGNNDRFMQVSGFDEFPVAIARYQVIGTQAYALGPGWYADGDNRMSYKMLEEGFTNMELFSQPPLQAQGTFFVDSRPGGITRTADANNLVKPLFDIAPVFPQIFELTKEKRADIEDAYNVKLFNMLGGAGMDKTGRTAYEISLRNQEKMQLLGPVIERQNSEYLNKIIERAYNICERAAVFPEFSDQVLNLIDGEGIKITYESPLTQAAKISQTQPLEGILNFIAQVGQLDPNAIIKLNTADLINKYAAYTGTPATVLRSDEEYEAIIQANAEAEAQAAQQEAMLAAAPAARDISTAAKNTNDLVSADNPTLERIMASIGSGGA